MSTKTPLKHRPGWITYEEAAAQFPWSLRTLNRMTASGEVETKRLFRQRPCVLLSVADLTAAAGEAA